MCACDSSLSRMSACCAARVRNVSCHVTRTVMGATNLSKRCSNLRGLRLPARALLATAMPNTRPLVLPRGK
jgi:hypothetical protein